MTNLKIVEEIYIYEVISPTHHLHVICKCFSQVQSRKKLMGQSKEIEQDWKG